MTTELTTHGTVAGTKEKLVRDLKGVVHDAEHLLKNAANSTAEEFAAARTQLGERLSEARSRLDEARIAVTDKARYSADVTHEYVQQNPWKVLGIAVAVGLVIGVLASRR